jgi:hypothetical protein
VGAASRSILQCLLIKKRLVFFGELDCRMLKPVSRF